jgi:hypothetical protein
MTNTNIATETGAEQLTLCSAPKLSRKSKTSGCKGTIATVAIESLRSGMTAEQALAAVLNKFPEAKTSIKCIYWYASKQGIALRNKPAPETKPESLEAIFSNPEATAEAFAKAGTVTKVTTPVPAKAKAPKLVKKAS